ncbi:protein FAM217A isoform X3 [Podarcis raffonei]|uniref:protein FAM217A isoform X3 n=1 Tax=Podarcis raffonei TaxID=65483 RepID=UPI0023293E9A|nr:protein FAM217A isoform X3 [Podarcis raffonei]
MHHPMEAGGGEPASSPAAAASETSGSFGGLPGLVRGSKNNKSASLVGKEDFIPGIYGNSTFSRQKPHFCNLESDFSAEKKFHSSEEKIAREGVLTGAFYKDHYNAAMEQLAALSLSKNTRTSQLSPNSCRQAPYHSWSYIHNQGNKAVSRDFHRRLGEMPSSSSDVPINFIHTNNPLVQSFIKRCHTVSYLETQKAALENCNRNGDGDFLKNEAIASAAYPATDGSSDDMLSVIRSSLKRGNGNVEDKPSIEKEISENEKRNKELLKYLKNVNVNLKPDPIEVKEDVSSSSESDTFSYPDFLPPPYNTWDLQKMSSSKFDEWKSSFNPPLEESLCKLISRLVEMEKLQHLTILKERTRETVSPTMAVNNRTSFSKDAHQFKQLKQSDSSCPQAGFDGDLHHFGCCMQELDMPKCTCQRCHSKWNSGASSPARPSTKPCRASCSRCNKCAKAPVILDSRNVPARRALSCSGSSQKIRSAVKTTSAKLLLPSAAVAYSLPDSESSKWKQPRTKRKPCRKNGALTSKLKSIPVISKEKCSPADQQ